MTIENVVLFTKHCSSSKNQLVVYNLIFINSNIPQRQPLLTGPLSASKDMVYTHPVVLDPAQPFTLPGVKCNLGYVGANKTV